MATKVQVVIDCHDEQMMLEFWRTALHYAIPDPPEPFTRWSDYWRSLDLPDEEITETPNSIVDPDGVGPRIVFMMVPEDKVVKNRVHLDASLASAQEARAPANTHAGEVSVASGRIALRPHTEETTRRPGSRWQSTVTTRS